MCTKLKFHKVSVLPGTLESDSLYVVKGVSDVEANLFITDSTGTSVPIFTESRVIDIINDTIDPELKIYPDIAARDAATLTQNCLVVVTDASADPTVDVGTAMYVWNNVQGEFQKLTEFESLDVTFTWTDIDGRPTSTPSEIDTAVSDSQQNKADLQKVVKTTPTSTVNVDVYTGDVNTLSTSIVYARTDLGATNTPTGSGQGILNTSRFSSTIADQVYYENQTSTKVYHRKLRTTWTDWEEIFTDNSIIEADNLKIGRDIALSGDVSGTANFDGSSNINISVTVQDDSHNHIISNVDGLQTALDSKLGISQKAADSDLLDGLNSTHFLDASNHVIDINGRYPNSNDVQGFITRLQSSNIGAKTSPYVTIAATDFDDMNIGESVFVNISASSYQSFPGDFNFGHIYTFGQRDFGNQNVGFWVPGGTAANQYGLYIFRRDASTAPEYEQVWTSRTDGAGSGLDADLLDGQQGSYYLDANNFTNVPSVWTDGDNLGNHTATENIKLNGFWLSNDGGNEGIFVDSLGKVGVNFATPTVDLDIRAANAGGLLVQNKNAGEYAQSRFLTDLGAGLSITNYSSSYSGGSIFGVGANGTAIHSSNPLIIGTTNADRFDLYTNDVKRLTVLPTGELGVNIVTPTHTVDVGGTGRFSSDFYLPSIADSTHGFIPSIDPTTGKVVSTKLSYSSKTFADVPRTLPGGGQDVVRVLEIAKDSSAATVSKGIKFGGNVPVTNNSSVSWILAPYNGNYSSDLEFYSGNKGNFTFDQTQASLSLRLSQDRIRFFTSTVAASPVQTEVFSIVGTKIGINKTIPTYELDITGDFATSGTAYINTWVTTNPNSGSITKAWNSNYYRYRFGGTGTPLGIMISNYDTPTIYLNRDGTGEFTGALTTTTLFADDVETNYIDFRNTNTVIPIYFKNGYEVYAEDTGGGSDNTRLWLTSPIGGEILLGPRGGSDKADLIFGRTNEFRLTDVTNGSLTYKNGGLHIGDPTLVTPTHRFEVNGSSSLDGDLFLPNLQGSSENLMYVNPTTGLVETISLSEVRNDATKSFTLPSDSAAGWYTIAYNVGNRAIGRFALRCVKSGEHGTTVFYASHYYGAAGSNQISILAHSSFSGVSYENIRIVHGTTYQGAMLQVYVRPTSNAVSAFLLGDEIQTDGWVLTDFVPDGTDPNGVSNPLAANMTTTGAEVDLSDKTSNVLLNNGDIYAGDRTTQYKVWHEGTFTKDEFVSANNPNQSDASVTKSGHYIVVDDVNSPSTRFILNNIEGNNSYITQLGGDGIGKNDLYFRIGDQSEITADSQTWKKLWHEGNHGTGSGLDADLFRGLTTDQFFRSDVVDKMVSASGITGSGTGVSNQAFFTFNESNGTTRQGYVGFGSSSNSTLFLYNDAVSSYLGVNTTLSFSGNEVWHEGNDGSGSGLDSDLLDGQQGSYYLDAANLTNKGAAALTDFSSTGFVAPNSTQLGGQAASYYLDSNNHVNKLWAVDGTDIYRTTTGSIRINGGSASSVYKITPSGTNQIYRWEAGTSATYLTSNYNSFSPNTQDDVALPSWRVGFGNDFYRVQRSPAGSTTMVDYIYVAGDGDVGIGSNNPSGKLEVNTSSGNAFFTRNAGDNGVTGTALAIGLSGDVRLSASGDLSFRVGAVGTAANLHGEKMKIFSTGLVRIPNLAGTGNRIVTTTPTGVLGAGIDVSTIYSASNPQPTNWTLSGNDIYSNNTGNVGIGTVTPLDKLHLNGGNLFLQGSSSDGTSGSLRLGNLISGSGWGEVYYDASSANSANRGLIFEENISSLRNFIFRQNGNELMRITGTGNVGIGSNNPSGKLEVNTSSGTAFFTRNAGDNGVTGTALGIGLSGGDVRLSASGDLSFRVGAVGTSANLQGEKMRLYSSGLLRINSLAGTGNRMVVADSDGDLTTQAIPDGADDLGNHTATQNIDLGAFWLSPDGTNIGLSLDAGGNADFSARLETASDVTVGGDLYINGATGGSKFLTVSPTTKQVSEVSYSNDSTEAVTITGRFNGSTETTVNAQGCTISRDSTGVYSVSLTSTNGLSTDYNVIVTVISSGALYSYFVSAITDSGFDINTVRIRVGDGLEFPEDCEFMFLVTDTKNEFKLT